VLHTSAVCFHTLAYILTNDHDKNVNRKLTQVDEKQADYWNYTIAEKQHALKPSSRVHNEYTESSIFVVPEGVVAVLLQDSRVGQLLQGRLAVAAVAVVPAALSAFGGTKCSLLPVAVAAEVA
jgi:hypothetical protein